MKSVVLAILNYNGRHHLEELLPNALAAAQRYPGKARVLVLDNRSTRDDVAWIGEHYPDAEVIVAPRNEFLFSYNWLLDKLDEEIVVLLNNDLRVSEDFIEPLARHFTRNDVFAVSATSRNWEDSEYTFGPIRLNQSHGIYYWVPEHERQKLSNTLFTSGGFMAVDRMKFLSLGGFNRIYWPAYCEDLDLCFRAWKNGWVCLFEPESVVFHKESGSWGRDKRSKANLLNYGSSLLFQWVTLPMGCSVWENAIAHARFILGQNNRTSFFKTLLQTLFKRLLMQPEELAFLKTSERETEAIRRRINGAHPRFIPSAENKENAQPWHEVMIKKHLTHPVATLFHKLKNFNKISLLWYESRNWGDALNPWLVEKLTGSRPVLTKSRHIRKCLAVGSILGIASDTDEIWGSGFISENEMVEFAPRKIHAVRGPLTRSLLLRSGIQCPEIYGDPALLIPRFFDPEVPLKYDLGIIPHYIEKTHPWVEMQKNRPDVRIIDIESGIEEFVSEVKSCRAIASSSLHGLICSDAYGIQNVWIKLTDGVIGGDFKFRDYRLSIGAPDPRPFVISEKTTVEEILKDVRHYPVNLDLDRLLGSCPFLPSRTVRKG